jgi:predicted metalloenzyme YecM
MPTAVINSIRVKPSSPRGSTGDRLPRPVMALVMVSVPVRETVMWSPTGWETGSRPDCRG